MAITLGTFTKQDNGTFTGTSKTLNVAAALSIVPVDKMFDNAPDHRVYAGPRYEVGAGWSQVATHTAVSSPARCNTASRCESVNPAGRTALKTGGNWG
jgi:uncharacterized protein (DUF736 family)